MTGTKSFFLGAAAAVVTLGLAGCGGSSTTHNNTGAASGLLTLGVIFPATTFDAANVNWANESPYIQAVYDTLVHETPDAKIVPWLATSWSYNAAKTVLTMKLRTDVKFTDGTPFNASVAAQNIMRFHNGTSTDKGHLASVKDAKAVDPSTLQITLTQPDPALLVYLAQDSGTQESPKAFNAPDVKTKPVGSGPYILDTGQTVIGSKYVFTKNSDYWAPSQQHYAKLVINVYATAATQVNALRAGQVDGLNLGSNAAVSELKAAGISMFPHELDWEGLVLFDRRGAMSKPLGNVKVRQAINYAIDRGAMLKAVDKGYGTVTGQVFGTVNPGYDASLDNMYPYNPGKAKQLLREAGYPNGLTLTLPEININGTTSFDLVKQYLGAVGINVKYVQVPVSDAIGDVTAAKFAASWFLLQEDPTAWQLANFEITSGAPFNVFHVKDATVDRLVAILQTGSTAESAAAAKQLNRYVVEQAWFDPWYRVQDNFAAAKNTNVVPQADNAYPYLWNITPKT